MGVLSLGFVVLRVIEWAKFAANERSIATIIIERMGQAQCKR
jgi:hypothetical protein